MGKRGIAISQTLGSALKVTFSRHAEERHAPVAFLSDDYGEFRHVGRWMQGIELALALTYRATKIERRMVVQWAGMGTVAWRDWEVPHTIYTSDREATMLMACALGIEDLYEIYLDSEKREAA